MNNARSFVPREFFMNQRRINVIVHEQVIRSLFIEFQSLKMGSGGF